MSIIKTFTYNLRCNDPRDGINEFKRRCVYVKKEFPKYDADIVGFQEVQPQMKDWLIENFTEYTIVGCGRDADLLGESGVIAFKTEKFELVSLETFWLSDTPNIPGTRFNTDQSNCPRICTVACLVERESRKCFRFYNTHLDHEGTFAQAQGISLVLSRIAKDHAVSPMPVILTGDFNVTPDSAVCKSVCKFTGCGTPLSDVTEDVGITFHAYRPGEVGIKIDYIFTTMPCDTSKSFTAKDSENGVYLSDHYPVGAYLEL